MLRTSGAEPSAHQARLDEHNHWLGFAQLFTECQPLITEAHRHREALPTPEEANLIRAEQAIHPRARHYIAGLIPEPACPITPVIRNALAVRKQAINQRITTHAAQTLSENPPWLNTLGPRPAELQSRARWNSALKTVLAYRYAYNITDEHQALGTQPAATTQQLHWANATKHLNMIHQTRQNEEFTGRTHPTPARKSVLQL